MRGDAWRPRLRASTQTLGLSRALAKAGHEVVVVTAQVDRASASHEVIDGVNIYRLPAMRLPKMGISLYFPWLNWTFWLSNLRRIESILERHAIDVLHVHNHMFDLALAGAAMKRRLRIPMVLTVHTIITHQIGAYNLLLHPAPLQAWAPAHRTGISRRCAWLGRASVRGTCAERSKTRRVAQ